MDIVVSHGSAWHFWRSFQGDIRRLTRVSIAEAMVKPAPLTASLRAELASCGFEPSREQPLDLLFHRDTTRSQSSRIRPHRTSRSLPPGSLVRLADEVLIASPELTFAQLSDQLPVGELALVGCELCGTYRLHGGDGCRLPMPAERPPLTSQTAIVALLRDMGYQRRSIAQQAARAVLNGAASPMEAKVALLLSLPTKQGGYGLPRPAMNAEIRLGPHGYRFYPHSPCRMDLYWDSASLDVEYDGVDAHPPEQHARDVARTAALMAEGVEVLTLTKAQEYHPQAFREVAELVADRIGHPLHLGEGFREAHFRLRRDLGFAQ